MKKIDILKIFNFFVLLIILVLFISLVFFNNSTFNFDTKNQIISFIVFFGFGYVLYKILNKVENKLNEKYKYILYISLLILFIFQIIIYLNIRTTFGWTLEE